MKLALDEKAILTLSTGIFAGVGTTLSLAGVPAILASSDPLPVWRQMYNNGKNIALTTILVTNVAGIRLYFIEKDQNYLIVAGLAASVVVWTFTAMLPINSTLLAIEDNNKAAEDARIRKLITQWGRKQWVRTTLGIGAFVVAVMACRK